MNKIELIELVRKIKNCEGSEKEIDEMIKLLKKSIIYPEIDDLIFYTEKSPEEIVEIAINYKAIQL